MVGAYDSNSSSFENAWTQILDNIHVWDEETLCPWRDLFNDEPRFEDFCFPLLHKVYLGICDKDFCEILAMTPPSDLDLTDGTGRTILSWAARRGDEKTVEMLLARGSSPDEADRDCWTPLHMSCFFMNTGCIKLLLAAGADVNAKTRDGYTLLFLVTERADRPDVVSMLLASGARTDPQTRDGWRPLHSAARWNRPGIIRCLISAGVQLDAKTRSGDTAISIAIASNSHECLSYLIKVTPAKLIQDSFEKYMSDAVTWGDRETIAILKSAGLGGPHLRKILDRPAQVELFRRATLRRDSHKERSETPLHLPNVESFEWFSAFEEFAGGPIDDGQIDCSTTLEGVVIAGRQQSLTEERLGRKDTNEELDGSSSVYEDARNVSPDLLCLLENRKKIELQCFKEATSESSKCENMAEERCSELVRVTPEENHYVITKTGLLWLLLLCLLLCLLPCIPWIVTAVVTTKDLSSLPAAVTGLPRFVDAICLLLLFGELIWLSFWRTWRSDLERLDHGFATDATSSRLNRGLLWISTPRFRTRLKPVGTLAVDGRCWTHKAITVVGDLSTHLRSILSKFCRDFGISEPELAEGKCRVRWRCVSFHAVLPPMRWSV